MARAFVSYSWDSEEHKTWVRALATRLRSDGVETTLDQWHLVPGDRLPLFMESAVRDSDYVLIVCTPRYKDRSDQRRGGVGYEGDVITGQALTEDMARKFIPVLRGEEWISSAPSWLAGKYYVDLRGNPYSEPAYDDLLSTLLGTRPEAPPVGEGLQHRGKTWPALLKVHIHHWIELDTASLAGDIVSLRQKEGLQPGLKVLVDAPDLRSLQDFVVSQANEGKDEKITLDQLATVDWSRNLLDKVSTISQELLPDLYTEFGLQGAISSLQFFFRHCLMMAIHGLASRQRGDREVFYLGFQSWKIDHGDFGSFAHAVYGLPRLVEVTVAAHQGAHTNDLHVTTYLPLGRLANDGSNGLLRG